MGNETPQVWAPSSQSAQSCGIQRACWGLYGPMGPWSRRVGDEIQNQLQLGLDCSNSAYFFLNEGRPMGDETPQVWAQSRQSAQSCGIQRVCWGLYGPMGPWSRRGGDEIQNQLQLGLDCSTSADFILDEGRPMGDKTPQVWAQSRQSAQSCGIQRVCWWLYGLMGPWSRRGGAKYKIAATRA